MGVFALVSGYIIVVVHHYDLLRRVRCFIMVYRVPMVGPTWFAASARCSRHRRHELGRRRPFCSFESMPLAGQIGLRAFDSGSFVAYLRYYANLHRRQNQVNS